MDFVAHITREGGPDFVPPAERIAMFDNAGTLRTEQPMYIQMVFALDRVKALAPQHPEWRDQQPFNAVLEGDLKALEASDEKGLVELLVATHAGMTTEDFEQIVKDWLATAKLLHFNRPYTACIYQPMVELLAYLRTNGFKTYIVSGGGIDFMRPWTEQAYSIPPEQVIGSSIKTKFEMRDGKPVLMRLPEIDFIDAGALLRFPGLEQRVCAELLPAVVRAAPLFQGNFGAASDPRIETRVRDGRRELLQNPEQYDLITIEPPPPSAAGVVNLYSSDFYVLAGARLQQGGLLAQWWPLPTQNDEDSRSLVRSFLDTFPHASLWTTEFHEMLLIGSFKPIELDVPRIAERFARPEVAAALREVGIVPPPRCSRPGSQTGPASSVM